MGKARPVLLATALLALAPAAASAEDFYVNSSSAGGDATCPQANPCNTIEQGIVAAGANTPGTRDVVRVAGGFYQQFALPGPGAGDYNDITVQGSGTGSDPGANTIVRPFGPTTRIVSVDAPVTGAEVKNLRVSYPDSDDTINRQAVFIGAAGTLLQDVVVDVQKSGADQAGITASTGRISLERVTLSKDTGSEDALVVTGGSATEGPSISDSVIETSVDASAIRVQSSPQATIRRSRLSSNGSTPTLELANAQLFLDSSVVTGDGGISILGNDTVFRSSEIRNSTIVGSASLFVSSENSTSTFAEVRSSILTGTTLASEPPGSVVAVTCTNSNLAALVVNTDYDCSQTRSNTAVDPETLFLSRAGGDYRLRAGSAAIDSGIPGSVAPASETDRLGNPRVRDGNGDGTATLDKGAFEYQRLAPVASIAGPDSGPAGPAMPYTASFVDPDPGDTVSYRWTFSHNEGVQEGPSASVSFPTPGTHTVTLTVTDPTGLTGTASKAVTIQPNPPGPGPTGPTATAGDDNIVLDAVINFFCGLAGNDRIDGGPGDDEIWGDQCNENARRLFGAAVGDGNDTLIGNTGNDRLFGSGGRDTLRGDAGNDTLRGGSGNDKLDGGDGSDKLSGAAGNDKLAGAAGNDTLSGGDGNDKLSGGAGRDKLTGGRGRNSYSAGAGDDTISAANKVRETINCGSGRKDRAIVDRADKVKGCEKVTRRR